MSVDRLVIASYARILLRLLILLRKYIFFRLIHIPLYRLRLHFPSPKIFIPKLQQKNLDKFRLYFYFIELRFGIWDSIYTILVHLKISIKKLNFVSIPNFCKKLHDKRGIHRLIYLYFKRGRVLIVFLDLHWWAVH